MKNYYIFAAFAAAAVLAACSKEANTPEITPAEETTGVITVNATIADLSTKVAFDAVYDANKKPTEMDLTWADGDKLRVYNHADKTQYSDFELTGGKGTKSGSFTGTPVTADSYDIEILNGPVVYGAQTQPSDGVTSSLKYMAGVNDVTDLSSITFTEFSSVLAITAKMPSSAIAALIESVNITASESIFNGGKTLSVTFNTKGDAGSDGILHFFATLPVGTTTIPAGTTLLLQFNAPGAAHDVYTRYMVIASAVDFEAKKLNTINVNATKSDKHAGATSCDGSSAEKAYLIGDKYQLDSTRTLLVDGSKKYFELVNDITVSSWSGIDCDSKGEIDLNGNDHKIIGLNTPLFVYLDGKVSNLTLSNASIKASASNYVGILARTVSSTKQCYISGVNIKNSSVNGKGTVGALIGRISATASCTVINCSSEASVSGSAYNVGGLVGQISNGSIINCSATGNVSTSSHFAGGLVGYVDGTVSIERCSATGDIILSADNSLANHGGLVANLAATANLTIANSYSTGHIGSDTYRTRRWCSGILGTPSAGSKASITNCYSTCIITSANPGLEGAIVGNNSSTQVTCSGFVGWTSITKMAGDGNPVSTDGNYLGTEGTIHSQAEALGGWDFENIWTTDGTPQLRPYVPAP